MNAAIARLSARGARAFASHAGAKPAHVHMPETAMLTGDGSHRFVRKGWEYSAYMGLGGGTLVLYLGLSNAPETDSEFFAREEAFAQRRGHEQFEVARRPSGPIYSRYVYERAEIGERPSLS